VTPADKNMINLLRQITPLGQGSQLEPSESCPVGMVMLLGDGDESYIQ